MSISDQPLLSPQQPDVPVFRGNGKRACDVNKVTLHMNSSSTFTGLVEQEKSLPLLVKTSMYLVSGVYCFTPATLDTFLTQLGHCSHGYISSHHTIPYNNQLTVMRAYISRTGSARNQTPSRCCNQLTVMCAYISRTGSTRNQTPSRCCKHHALPIEHQIPILDCCNTS
jgi:hypothetical protein